MLDRALGNHPGHKVIGLRTPLPAVVAEGEGERVPDILWSGRG